MLLDAGVRVPLVVTHRDDPKENVWYASVAELARKQGLPTLLDPTDAEILDRARAIAPDLIFSFYYRRMLPPEVLATAKRGAYNMHGSLLPKFRGRAPLNWAILKGESETGATLHVMTEKPDAGGIVDQQAVPIGPDDLAVDVMHRITDAAAVVLRRSLKGMIDGTVRLRPNDLSKGSYFGARRPEDGRIDWTKSARDIHNLVRAVAPPYPGAFSGNLRVLRTAMTDQRSQNAPGPYRQGADWFAVCGDGKVLRLLEVQEK